MHADQDISQYNQQNEERYRNSGHLRHLPFDRADYGPARVPCQLFAATFGMTGLHYHVQVNRNTYVSVAKKQIETLMALGAFIAVRDTELKTIPGGTGLSMEVSICTERMDHYNLFKTPLAQHDVQQILSRHYVALPKSGPRKVYTFDYATGKGSNLNRIHGGAA